MHSCILEIFIASFYQNALPCMDFTTAVVFDGSLSGTRKDMRHLVQRCETHRQPSPRPHGHPCMTDSESHRQAGYCSSQLSLSSTASAVDDRQQVGRVRPASLHTDATSRGHALSRPTCWSRAAAAGALRLAVDESSTGGDAAAAAAAVLGIDDSLAGAVMAQGPVGGCSPSHARAQEWPRTTTTTHTLTVTQPLRSVTPPALLCRPTVCTAVRCSSSTPTQSLLPSASLPPHSGPARHPLPLHGDPTPPAAAPVRLA